MTAHRDPRSRRTRTAGQLREAYARPLSPTCEGCKVRACSWNTRTGEWTDTCSACRGDEYFDNDHMIGQEGRVTDQKA
ncbi:hypothetical protein JCM4814A_78390 [Streptomyces phaeofaciens JCM 4814]|uniref:Uncharacterized protein n=1 Tax=Streptomyces phaeofaciens TaxID=68254 RepID=A0A918M234_9ACTN|nr:hypothetical protein GCM10010226_90080 [Streptomyces phaeofaciens]